MATLNVNQPPETDEAVDMHAAYTAAHACGFEKDLMVHAHRAQKLAARLRGISGITAVLLTDNIDVDLGSFIRGALVEAANALSDDCLNELDEIREYQEKKQLAAKAALEQPA